MASEFLSEYYNNGGLNDVNSNVPIQPSSFTGPVKNEYIQVHSEQVHHHHHHRQNQNQNQNKPHKRRKMKHCWNYITNTWDHHTSSTSGHWIAKIFINEMIGTMLLFTIICVGSRMLGSSALSFSITQGSAIGAVAYLFYGEDFGGGNPVIAFLLCMLGQYRLKSKWIFLVQWLGQLVGGFLAMAGTYVLLNDLPGTNTFGTPFPNPSISRGAVFFGEFIGCFIIYFVILWGVCLENQRIKMSQKKMAMLMGNKFQQTCQGNQKGLYRLLPVHQADPGSFVIALTLVVIAVTMILLDLTGSSFNVLRWAIPRICLNDSISFNANHLIYYLLAPVIAGLLVSIPVYLRHKVWRKRLDKLDYTSSESSSL